jgi:hypothetical protein
MASSIRIVEDVGAPVAVAAVNIVTKQYLPKYNDWANYIMTVGGYVGAAMNWGGPFLKNVGIASFPLSAERIYDRVRGAAVSGSVRRVSRYPAPETQAPFNGVRLV